MKISSLCSGIFISNIKIRGVFKMKKILFAIMLLVLLVGCGKNGTTEQTTATKTSDISGMDRADVFNTGKEAKCTAKIEGNSAVFYVKNGKERVESSTPSGDSVVIFDGKMMYAWDAETKQGVMMDLEKMDKISESSTTETEVRDVGEMNKMAADVKCQAAKVSDDMFVPPSDVQLIDMVKLAEQMKAMTQN